MTRDELRVNIAHEVQNTIRKALFIGHDWETATSCADRILALLPQQPKLEWQGRYLKIGDLTIGYYYGPHDSDNGARAAVEEAVRKALTKEQGL